MASNTSVVTHPDGSLGVKLHETEIVRFKGAHISLNSGGWRTRLTQNRMNEYLGPRGYQVVGPTTGRRKGEWTVVGAGTSFPFKDHMHLLSAGEAV